VALDILKQRVPATTCARCRKQLSPGDRVQMAMIVQGIGRNPSTKSIDAMISEEFELAHIDCMDTSLSGKLIRA
jgi:hypothetical protein